MSFYIRNYTSEEKFDIAKFMQYIDGVYDVISSPFLSQLQQLPTVKYYYVDEGYKEVDLIALDMYGDSFYAYLVQYYNGDFRESFPEGTVLRMFSLDDLNEVYTAIIASQNLEEEDN